jgi:hypothetical protein
MPPQRPSLPAGDVAELGELLTFLGDWLTGPDTGQLDASLRRFVGTNGYDLPALRQDLARFTFLLGNDDGQRLFSTAGD